MRTIALTMPAQHRRARFSGSVLSAGLTVTAADVTYICGLGPHAYPAVEQFVPARPGERVRYIACMGKHLTEFLSDADDWRGWGFRNQRLQNFLNHPPEGRAAPTAAAPG